ncbi:MAG: dihydropteroate synthase [Candidatus Deianiraeaceae bacterium]|jgi:dihydropteroate synthase
MKIFGILNVTPDSFSDGGEFITQNNAIKHAKELCKKCYALDIGSQSTRPNAPVISYKKEIHRLGNIISEVSKFANTSIDSYHFETQNFALTQGVSFINDVSSFQDTRIFHDYPKKVKFIFMHSLTIPTQKSVVMQSHKMDMVNEIKHWAKQKIAILTSYGAPRESFILDIGIGFGKTAEQSLYLIEHIEEFLDIGIKIMVGHSRKSFMEIIKDNSTTAERDNITREITKELERKGVHYVRVHKP